MLINLLIFKRIDNFISINYSDYFGEVLFLYLKYIKRAQRHNFNFKYDDINN
jgi:hypothetical protein